MPPSQQPREGQTATNPKTGAKVVWTNGAWRNPPAAPGAPVSGPAPHMAPQDRTYLDTLNGQAANALEAQQQYDAAIPAIKRFKPGPTWGPIMESLTAKDGGGFFDALGGMVGAIPRTLGAITPQETQDFQTLRAIQARRVLEEQTRQKGVQTEGDAARIKAGDLGPYMDTATNLAVIEQHRQALQRTQQRAQFYTAWANKYGLNAVNENGESVEAAFNKMVNAAPPAAPAGGHGGPTIRRIN